MMQDNLPQNMLLAHWKNTALDAMSRIINRSVNCWNWYTYANILEVPANFFDVDATVERHPTTSKKPAAGHVHLNIIVYFLAPQKKSA